MRPFEWSFFELFLLFRCSLLQTYDEETDFPTRGDRWDVKKFCSKIKIDIINESEDEMALEFDLIHVEAPIANTLRRVLLAEVSGAVWPKQNDL